jgi:hypothetical protein
VFAIQDLPGVNAVADFNRGDGDIISFQGTGLTSFSSLVLNVNMFQTGYGTLIIVDADTQVAIFGQNPGQLLPTDFAFS